MSKGREIPQGQGWFLATMQDAGLNPNEWGMGVCFGLGYGAKDYFLAEDSIETLAHNIRLAHDVYQDKNLGTSLEVKPELHLFLKKVAAYQETQNQDSKKTAADLMTENLTPALKEKGGIVSLDAFSGAYSPDELTMFIRIMEDELKAANFPVAFLLDNVSHVIIEGRNSTHSWTMIDVHQLSEVTKSNRDEKEVAKQIGQAFSFQYLEEKEGSIKIPSTFSNSIFSTTIFVTADHIDQLKEILENCKKKSEWLAIHAVTPDKAKLKDAHGLSWFFIAAQTGDLEVVKRHLEIKDFNPNEGFPLLTALMTATQKGYLSMVEALLTDPRTNPNQGLPNGLTPLFIAVDQGNIEMVKLLLKNGADLKVGKDALVLANDKGLDEIKALLMASVGINTPDNRSSTAVIARAGIPITRKDEIELKSEVNNASEWAQVENEDKFDPELLSDQNKTVTNDDRIISRGKGH